MEGRRPKSHADPPPPQKLKRNSISRNFIISKAQYGSISIYLPSRIFSLFSPCIISVQFPYGISILLLDSILFYYSYGLFYISLYYPYSVGVFSTTPEKIFSHRFFGPFSSILRTFRGGPERNSISGSQIKKRALFRNKTRDNHKKHLTWKISLDFAAEGRLMRQKCLPDTKIVNGCERCNGDVGDFLLLLEYFRWEGCCVRVIVGR